MVHHVMGHSLHCQISQQRYYR